MRLVAVILGMVMVAVTAGMLLGWLSLNTPPTSSVTSSSDSSTTSTSSPAAVTADAQQPLSPAHPIGQRDWLLVAKDPAGHTGDRLIVFGRVEQFDAGTGTSGFLAVVDGIRHSPGYVDYPTATALVGDPGTLSQFVKGDMFTAEVTVAGVDTYDNVMGGKSSVPRLAVTSIRAIS